MSDFTILSVAEDNYQSDRLSAVRVSPVSRAVALQLPETLHISVTNQYELIMSIDHKPPIVITGFGTNTIDGLIEYLLDAKQFLKDEQLVKELMGRNNNWASVLERKIY